ncbi:hypothetical protein VCHA57P527_40041 [Vibrio chagasii]|nr:hypothetical protein VCHA57P527_40041 [Vibrio chagasii]
MLECTKLRQYQSAGDTVAMNADRYVNGTQTVQHYADELDVAITRSLAISVNIEQYRVKGTVHLSVHLTMVARRQN